MNFLTGKLGGSAEGGGGFRLSRGWLLALPGLPSRFSPFPWCQRWFLLRALRFFLHQIRRGYLCSLNGLSSVYSVVAVVMHLFIQAKSVRTCFRLWPCEYDIDYKAAVCIFIILGRHVNQEEEIMQRTTEQYFDGLICCILIDIFSAPV